MRQRLQQVASVLSLAIAFSVIAACATNPVNRWAQARDALTTTQDSLLIAHKANMIDDGDLLAADPMIQAARAGLDKAETYLPEGGSGFESMMGIVDSMLFRLGQMAEAGQLPGVN